MFEFSSTELEAIRKVARQDVAEARSYSTPREQLFSVFDDPTFTEAPSRASELSRKLARELHLGHDLARLLRKSGFEQTAVRLFAELEGAQVTEKLGNSEAQYYRQRGTLR